jgi:predicted nucleic acid-binding protein
LIFVVDTSSFQRFLAGFFRSDTSAVRKAIARHQAYLPPVVVTEALRLADTLIAQCCLDYDAPLITYDDDFDNFVDLSLRLL